MRIKKVTIQDMWSFGQGPVTLDLSQQLNVVIGKNNSGKSNIRRALEWFTEHADWFAPETGDYSQDPIDIHQVVNPEAKPGAKLELSVTFTPEEARSMLESTCRAPLPDGLLKSACDGFSQGIELAFDYRWSGRDDRKRKVRWSGQGPIDGVFNPKGLLLAPEVLPLWKQLKNDLRARIVERVSEGITILSGWRKLSDDKVEQLSEWKAPSTSDYDKLRDFERIQRLFQRATRLENATLFPMIQKTVSQKKALNIKWRGRYLPIESFGDGIRHLLLMAFEFARVSGHVFVVEEPETHLHPELQRHLMAIIKKDEDNQFIMTTHSPVLLDAGRAEAVYRVEYNGDESTVSRCNTTGDLYDVLDDLDVRASDLLQANMVIWVEGPTDRMFLKKCFELLRSDLVEKIDYQIVCYGGKLRSHVAFDEGNALVNLLALSRHVAMVCDSDKRTEQDDIDETKKRLEEECKNANGYYWITAGREIENYFPDSVLTSAFRELLSDDEFKVELGQYEKLDEVLLKLVEEPGHGNKWKVDYKNNKIKIMPAMLKHLTLDDLDRFDLRERLDTLVKRIEEANRVVCSEL
ncbi:MAG: AAA family ATPase [Phycisphaerales bacterium]|nr:MAG: AAA family ATPase [Phycisphaerales bacterium]